MRPTIALSAVLIATSVIAIPSHAKVSAMLKAGELLDYCTGKDGSLGSAVCDAYMMGYMAGVNGTTEPTRPGPLICFPLHVSAEDVRAAFVKRMTDNSLRPDVKTFGASGVMMVATSDKYPCPGAK